MSEYNGHHCKTCWNVALWIGNEEPLYRLAQDCVFRLRADGKPPTIAQAATRFLRAGYQGTKTPDGYRFSRDAVTRALASIKADGR